MVVGGWEDGRMGEWENGRESEMMVRSHIVVCLNWRGSLLLRSDGVLGRQDWIYIGNCTRWSLLDLLAEELLLGVLVTTLQIE